MSLSPFEELKTARASLFSTVAAGKTGEDFNPRYTELIDQYFRKSHQESKIGQSLFHRGIPLAYLAVGGYGRKELCYHSDIDILVLFGSSIPTYAKGLAGEIFYPLWDLGLDLGYGVRTIKDCVTLCRDDFKVLSSLLDARFICGDSPLYVQFTAQLQRKVLTRKEADFLRWLEDQAHVRMSLYGDASHQLEPHLKEGLGGLRDYHHILWLARVLHGARIPRDLEYHGLLSHREYQDLIGHLQLIWLVRNTLHHLSRRKNDRLNIEYQEQMARAFGFRNRKGVLAVERFMGRLQGGMSAIKGLHQAFVRSQNPKRKTAGLDPRFSALEEGLQLDHGGLTFTSPTAILSEPMVLTKIFVQSARLNMPLSMEAARLVREFLYLIDDAYREASEAAAGFLEIINGDHAPETLDQMFETGFLDAFIPEFKAIKNRVQFNTYHTFPVGRHSLETLKHLKRLNRERNVLLLDIFADLPNPESLLLSGIFHDVGKRGKNHARRGVALTRRILRRFGFDQRRMDDVLFLVGHHLVLMEHAARRDLNDEKAVVQCARTIGCVDRLKMLYLLTWADAVATGPRAWNAWIANLVQELFFKIMHIMERGELATPDVSKKVKQKCSRIRKYFKAEMEAEAVEELVETMSPRYLLNTPFKDITRHVGMVRRLRVGERSGQPHAFQWETRKMEGEGCWEVAFLSKDRPGLFSDLAGILALNSINILSAHIYTWRDGTAVDLFKVTGPLDPLHPNERWKKVKEDLARVFQGDLELPGLLNRKGAPSLLSGQKRRPYPPRVLVDNQSSDFFTLIEVFTTDRVGLLFAITRTLYDHRLDVRIAKIATHVDQVADVFYVRDWDGQKVESKEREERIKTALYRQLIQDTAGTTGS